MGQNDVAVRAVNECITQDCHLLLQAIAETALDTLFRPSGELHRSHPQGLRKGGNLRPGNICEPQLDLVYTAFVFISKDPGQFFLAESELFALLFNLITESVQVATQIIQNAELAYKTMVHMAEYGYDKKDAKEILPPMLEVKNG